MRTITDEDDLATVYDCKWFKRQDAERRHNKRMLMVALLLTGASLFSLGFLLGTMQ